MSNLKNELVEAFYRMGFSLRGEQVLHDSQETEYRFKSSDEIIKVTVPPTEKSTTLPLGGQVLPPACPLL